MSLISLGLMQFAWRHARKISRLGNAYLSLKLSNVNGGTSSFVRMWEAVEARTGFGDMAIDIVASIIFCLDSPSSFGRWKDDALPVK